MNYDLALLVLRLATGLTLAAHGSQKLFGWFGGPGLKGMTAGMTHMRMQPAALWATMAGLTEFGGGLLLAVGLLHPLGTLGVVSAMLVAIFIAHWPRFFNTDKGMEFPLLILVNALVIGIGGTGSYSLDALIGLSLPEPITLIGGLVLVVIGVGVAFATRTPAVAAVKAGEPTTTSARG